jgi:zinc transport system substrate-binding protein
MSAGIDFIPAAEHGPIEGAQDTDIHVWLAPYTVRIAAENIARAMESLDPARQAQYRVNLARFLADIDALDKDIRSMLSGLKQRNFMVYHPAFGYFAKQYGLVQIAIETEGKEPSPPRLISLIQQARRDGIRTVFVEKGYSTKSARVIAREIGGQVVELDPMAHDWLANMRRVAEVLSRSLGHG